MAKYWRSKILVNLVNDSQFVKISPNKNLPLKGFRRRAEVIHQFIATKSLVCMHSPKFFYLSNIFGMYSNSDCS